VLYAAFVSAIVEMRVNSVEDGNAHERGAEKSHLSLPLGRKSISGHQNTGAQFLIPFVIVRGHPMSAKRQLGSPVRVDQEGAEHNPCRSHA
jgi:hypothetical protein